MKHTWLALSLAAGLTAAFAAAPVAALAGDATQNASVNLSAKKKHRAVRVQESGYIACVKGGCRPTPPGCRPAVGREYDDLPSTYDVIVCAPRRYPG